MGSANDLTHIFLAEKMVNISGSTENPYLWGCSVKQLWLCHPHHSGSGQMEGTVPPSLQPLPCFWLDPWARSASWVCISSYCMYLTHTELHSPGPLPGNTYGLGWCCWTKIIVIVEKFSVIISLFNIFAGDSSVTVRAKAVKLSFPTWETLQDRGLCNFLQKHDEIHFCVIKFSREKNQRLVNC